MGRLIWLVFCGWFVLCLFEVGGVGLWVLLVGWCRCVWFLVCCVWCCCFCRLDRYRLESCCCVIRCCFLCGGILVVLVGVGCWVGLFVGLLFLGWWVILYSVVWFGCRCVWYGGCWWWFFCWCFGGIGWVWLYLMLMWWLVVVFRKRLVGFGVILFGWVLW